MKVKSFATNALVLLTSFLLSCSLVPEGGKVLPIDSSEEARLMDKEDYLVDFSTGEWNNSFFFANGYKNGDPFNCYWKRNAGVLEDGVLKLNLYKNDETHYYGAEYRSARNEFHYGYYATRMKPVSCSGVISSFFSYTNYPCWDEIDIEFLGKDTTKVQLNYYTNGQGNHEYVYNLGFDASLDFHEYGFEWLPDSITWYVDGYKVYRATKDIPSNPQHIMMNLWNQKGQDIWAGALDETKLPVQAQYEFIAYISVDVD